MTENKEKMIDDFVEHAVWLAERIHTDELIPGYSRMPDWLSPAKVAPHVGKSTRWVIDHIDKFAGTRRDENGYYMIPKTAILRYLRTRTEEV